MLWRCQRKIPKYHDIKLSVRHGTWYAESNLTLEEITKYSYMWSTLGLNEKQITSQLNISDNTNVDWASFCREVCGETMLRESESGKQIGGQDIVVEIDESKFAKRKYHRGHDLKLGWVFGGREKENGRNCFAVVVPDRSEATLLPIILKYIARGSIIYSDCWAAYNKLTEYGYKHLTVNHSVNFKDPGTGCCTNGIEGDWQKMKYGGSMPKFGIRQHMLQGYLDVYMWRRKNEGSDLYKQMMKDATKLYNGTCNNEKCKHCMLRR